MNRSERLLAGLAAFFSTGRFAVFALATLFFYQFFLVGVVFWPPSGSVWGAFAQEFRIRCFQYNPQTGWMQWSLVLIMISEPLLLQAIIAAVWRGNLRQLWEKQRRVFVPLTSAAFVLVMMVASTLIGSRANTPQAAEFPFPGDRIRTQLPMPAFTLADQRGESISIEKYRGKVVLVTAVYSTCTGTCPMILLQIRRVLADLSPEEHDQLAVIAISLNPEEDTVENRSLTVEQYYGAERSNIHFVNGNSAEIDPVLDRLQVLRSRNAETGQIDHSNLFFVLDREGRIAYRLSLSERHEAWLIAALRAVLADAPSS
jgi:protein SCO1